MNNHISSKYQISHQNKGYSNKYPLLKETQKILDRAKSEGFALPSDNTIAGMNVLIREQIKSGIWNKLDDFFQYSYNSNPSFHDNTEFSSNIWSYNRALIQPNMIEAPDGSFSADKLIANSVNGTHYMSSVNQPVHIEAGEKVTMSIYAKSAEYNQLRVFAHNDSQYFPSVIFDLSNHTYNELIGAKGNIEGLGNGWYRCSVTITAQYTGDIFFLVYNLDNSGNLSFTGNDTDGIYIWGIQLDSGSEAKTFIPDLKNFSKINWKKSESNLATIHGGCKYTAQGWEGNGIDGYLKLNNPKQPNSKYTLHDACLGAVQYKISTLHSNSVAKRLCMAFHNDTMTILEGAAGSIRHRINSTVNMDVLIYTGGLGFKYLKDTAVLERTSINKDTISTSTVQHDVPDTDGSIATHFTARLYDTYSNLGISCYMQGAALTNNQVQLFRTLYNNYYNKIGLPQIA